MREEVNFYSILAKVLLMFNFLSLFFTFVLLLIYAWIEYVGLQIIDIAENLFGTDSIWFAGVIDLFELILEIPAGMDLLFMAIITVATMNLFYVSYKMERGGWVGFFFFISIGMAIWLYIASKIVELRNDLQSYLSSTMLIKPDTTFFDYFTMYSLEISAFIFLAAIVVHMIDWENVREKVGAAISKETSMEDTIEERFEQ